MYLKVLFYSLLVFVAACSSDKRQSELLESNLEKAVLAIEAEIASDYEVSYKSRHPTRAETGYHCKFKILDIRYSSSNNHVAQVIVERWAENDFGNVYDSSQSLALYDRDAIHIWQRIDGQWKPDTSDNKHPGPGTCIYKKPWRN